MYGGWGGWCQSVPRIERESPFREKLLSCCLTTHNWMLRTNTHRCTRWRGDGGSKEGNWEQTGQQSVTDDNDKKQCKDLLEGRRGAFWPEGLNESSFPGRTFIAFCFVVPMCSWRRRCHRSGMCVRGWREGAGGRGQRTCIVRLRPCCYDVVWICFRN